MDFEIGGHHEVCVCGFCRCEHRAGFLGRLESNCGRYTWPGAGADLPANHPRGVRFPVPGEPRPRRTHQSRGGYRG